MLGNYKGYNYRVIWINDHFCGYVRLLVGQPYYGTKDYYEINIDCHGGLSFGEFIKSKDYSKIGQWDKFDGEYWIGWDYNHGRENEKYLKVADIEIDCKNVIDQLVRKEEPVDLCGVAPGIKIGTAVLKIAKNSQSSLSSTAKVVWEKKDNMYAIKEFHNFLSKEELIAKYGKEIYDKYTATYPYMLKVFKDRIHIELNQFLTHYGIADGKFGTMEQYRFFMELTLKCGAKLSSIVKNSKSKIIEEVI